MQISFSRLLALSLYLPVTFFTAAANHHAHAVTSTSTQEKATRKHIEALQRNELPKAALDAARKYPTLMSEAEMRGLEADYLAELTRLAAIPARQEADRFAVADRAIAGYDALIPAWQALGPAAQTDVLRLRFDRIQALHARVRTHDIVQEYETLKAQGITPPRYILGDVASAYLYLRQPEMARDLYRQTLDDPESALDTPNVQLANETGLFYALIETEDFEAAHQTIDVAKTRLPVWLYPVGSKERFPNDLRVYAEQTAAMGLLYADDTTQAYQKLQDMVRMAPNHSGLRTSLAHAERVRQHPRAAERHLKLAEAGEPLAPDVLAEQFSTAMDLQEWEQSEHLIQNLQSRFPEDLQTQDLLRDWETHNKAELVISGHRGLESDSPVAGQDDFGIDAVIYSQPIAYNWRLFAGGGYSSSEFEEGSGHYRWARTGAEWRSRDLSAEVEVSGNNYGYGNKMGARATVAYDLNDQWQLGAAVAKHDRAAPLRALRNDISVNSANAFVRWRGNEQREWNFSVKPSRFSDGNHRLEANLNGRERLYTSPHFKADLLVGVGATRNSADDTPYFNPKSDLEVLPAINLTHILYRRYDTVLEHNLLLGAGIYKQQGYGSGAIGALAYGMRYRFNRTVDVGATVSAVSRPYDGTREREVRVVFDMNFRF